MSTQIEDVFDDDTDLPLPSFPSSSPFPSASAPQPQPQTITDPTPYASWSIIYPLHLDASRPYTPTARRLPLPKSLLSPLSKDIADAASRLGLPTLHEVTKSHPRDWENPGRVRIRWRDPETRKLVNPAVTSKKHLMEMIALYIQRTKPESIPIPKPKPSSSPTPNTTPSPSPAPTPPTAKSKGKQPSNSHSRTKSLRDPSRISPYSPALESGILIDTVLAGITAEQEQAAQAPPAAAAIAPGAGAKQKKKVIRVRQ